MRAAWAFAVMVASACSSNEPLPDGGAPLDAGTCCPRGTPTLASCGPSGPVAVGGFSAGGGGCKQMTIPACHHVHSSTDAHGCAIWVDDGPCDCDGGSVCPSSFGEIDISAYTPETMRAPRTPSKACTAQEIADFAACHTGDASKCTASDASSCAACSTSNASDAAWGPFVQGGATQGWNIGGCVDLVLGQTALEPDSCGAKIDATDGCVAYVCGGCAPFSAEEDTCAQAALQHVCSGFQQKVDACSGLADAGQSVNVCFPDATLTDPVARQRDFITRLAAYFCGP